VHRCPKCGHRERFNWPAMLFSASSGILFVLLMLTEDYVPRSYRIWVIAIGLFGFLLSVAGTLWRGYRDRMEDVEYSRSQELQKLN
jgi:hypothetical protein